MANRLSVGVILTLAEAASLSSSNSGRERSKASTGLDGHSSRANKGGRVVRGGGGNGNGSLESPDLSGEKSSGEGLNLLLDGGSGGVEGGDIMNDYGRGRGDSGGDGGLAPPAGGVAISDGVG